MFPRVRSPKPPFLVHCGKCRGFSAKKSCSHSFWKLRDEHPRKRKLPNFCRFFRQSLAKNRQNFALGVRARLEFTEFYETALLFPLELMLSDRSQALLPYACCATSTVSTKKAARACMPSSSSPSTSPCESMESSPQFTRRKPRESIKRCFRGLPSWAGASF